MVDKVRNMLSALCQTLVGSRRHTALSAKSWMFLFLLAFFFVSCSQKAPMLTGDLIFVEGMSEGTMDQAIMNSTGAMVHVGIVEVCDDSVFVIDAAPKTGVSRRPWAEFLEAQKDDQGRMPNMKLMRLKDNRDVADFVVKAKSLCGAEYDFTFLPDNGKYYCSELVYECYQRNGQPIFKSAPMNFRNAAGEFDPYWIELFEQQGMAIPQGVPGTNPEGMRREEVLKLLK